MTDPTDYPRRAGWRGRQAAPGARHRKAGRVAQATGDRDEGSVEAALAHYARTGAARLVKRPTPFRQIGPVGADGRFSGVRTKAAGVDYSGVLKGGRHCALEVKGTSSASVPLSRQGKPTLTYEQRRELAAVHDAGGVALVLCKTSHQLRGRVLCRWWLLDWPGWVSAEEAAGKHSAQSLSVETLHEFGEEVDPGATGWPDWLAALQRLEADGAH